MFAFALHDAERGETLLARDPLGIKPLYLADDGQRLVFASEVRAIRRVATAAVSIRRARDLPALGLDRSAAHAAPPDPRAARRVAGCASSSRGVEARTRYFRLEDELGRPSR
jgi:asparagine synthase (glutamine-hydrolysing)